MAHEDRLIGRRQDDLLSFLHPASRAAPASAGGRGVPRQRQGAAAVKRARPSEFGTPGSRQLHHQLSLRPALTRGHRWRHRLLSLASVDDRPTVLATALTQMQAPVTTGRRVGIFAAHGGAGATTLALGLTRLLHAHRRDAVALVDGAPSRAALASRLIDPPSLSVSAICASLTGSGARRYQWAPGSDAAIFTPAASDGTTTRTVVEHLRRRVGFVVLDAGTRLVCGGIGAPDLDAAVVVADLTVRGMASAHATVQSIIQAGGSLASIVLVLTARDADAGVNIGQARSEFSRWKDLVVLDLPRDRHLAGAAQVRIELIAPATLSAFIQVGAATVSASTGNR